MITKDKITKIFCIIDKFNRNLNAELENNLFLPTNNGKGKRYRNRKDCLSESEIMTILVCYHFGTYRNFKEYYEQLRNEYRLFRKLLKPKQVLHVGILLNGLDGLLVAQFSTCFTISAPTTMRAGLLPAPL